LAFGLRLRSALSLPELPHVPDDGRAADVVLERGPVPERLDGAVEVAPSMLVSPARFQLALPAARFSVREGKRIVVDARAGSSDDELRPYLLGTVMGALCLQRGLLPLHAAAVLSRGGAAALAGPSGVGKSTLAAQFQSRGCAVLADDLLAVEIPGDGDPLARQGLARLRLRTAGDESKISLPISRPENDQPWPLRRVYILRADGSATPELRRLRGPEAVSGLLGQVYRWPIAVAMDGGQMAFAHCLALARRSEIFTLSFAHDASTPATIAEALEAHIASSSPF
jgi:hypothetical protein